ncbi:nitroreductase family deazaflavin-dependent oxidoreductase [Streptomyces sp. NBC_00237]|uniref:nitroreductase family deazaflavin-dependent oxidoreductase n=1 Tax=Streptomyces sp. NBC_00237 TaxID=2975687 RepID=UPI002256FA43|nr:nitroreductase family deazaflavin-dependent oxidoreductase [Streptomyces sp. NBC_00237]MCX5207090.1 nitroreductase family deazaflavin-dependent oxidoreductase [Streptomyces sp. NBC_00237]
MTSNNTSSGSGSTHYVRPSRVGNLLNGTVGWLARHGVSLLGSAELSVLGRKSGEWRRVPVNPLPYENGPYLVSARGHSEWVRNMRAAGGGKLQVGRRTQEFTAVELPDAEKPVILRKYLKKWGWEVGRFFGDVTVDSTDEELLAAAHKHPVFRITLNGNRTGTTTGTGTGTGTQTK